MNTFGFIPLYHAQNQKSTQKLVILLEKNVHHLQKSEFLQQKSKTKHKIIQHCLLHALREKNKKHTLVKHFLFNKLVVILLRFFVAALKI